FKTKTQTKQKIWDWLLDQKIKQLNSKFYSLVSTKVNTGQYAWQNSTNFELCADEMFPVHSVNSEYYTKYLKAYIDKDINRSVIFLGPPGTGKSTLIQTVLQNLQLTSFRFKYDPLTT